MKRVMFYCQHVLGMGHLVRSTEIVRALARDFSVLFVTGGEIPEGFSLPKDIETFQLIPLKTSPDFSDLLLCDFSWDLEETKAIRRELLLHAFDDFQPDVLVTELFPFGRKQFSFELLPLLTRARFQGKTMIVSSIRDILVSRKNQQEYEERVYKTINSFYDLVLVHGDERHHSLEESFSRVPDLSCPVAYTGYVVQPPPSRTSHDASFVAREKPRIVMSNGSGQCPSGHHLLESVLRAAPLLTSQVPHELHVFAGPLVPDGVYDALQRMAAPLSNVILCRYTPDLPAHLRQADLSISMAGYNTVMDILATGVRALVYPVTGNGDDEQAVRAGSLAGKGVLQVLDEEQLQPENLVRQIQNTLSRKPRQIPFNNSGAVNSSMLIQKHLAAREQRIANHIRHMQTVYEIGAAV